MKNMSISGKPSLNQLREHFKNAEVIECLQDNEQYIYDKECPVNMNCGEIIYAEYLACCSDGTFDPVNLWTNKKGYAKIITTI